MNRIEEIDKELEEISKETSRLFEKERSLDEEKDGLLLQDLFQSKFLNKYKWRVLNRPSGFILDPVCNDISEFDEIQNKLRLYPHGSFKLANSVEIIGSDGATYIICDDIKKGIEFIESQNIKISVSENITEKITSLEEELTTLKSFVGEFNKKR